jgi:hypothetical protein
VYSTRCSGQTLSVKWRLPIFLVICVLVGFMFQSSQAAAKVKPSGPISRLADPTAARSYFHLDRSTQIETARFFAEGYLGHDKSPLSLPYIRYVSAAGSLEFPLTALLEHTGGSGTPYYAWIFTLPNNRRLGFVIRAGTDRMRFFLVGSNPARNQQAARDTFDSDTAWLANIDAASLGRWHPPLADDSSSPDDVSSLAAGWGIKVWHGEAGAPPTLGPVAAIVLFALLVLYIVLWSGPTGPLLVETLGGSKTLLIYAITITMFGFGLWWSLSREVESWPPLSKENYRTALVVLTLEFGIWVVVVVGRTPTNPLRLLGTASLVGGLVSVAIATIGSVKGPQSEGWDTLLLCGGTLLTLNVFTSVLNILWAPVLEEFMALREVARDEPASDKRALLDRSAESAELDRPENGEPGRTGRHPGRRRFPGG